VLELKSSHDLRGLGPQTMGSPVDELDHLLADGRCAREPPPWENEREHRSDESTEIDTIAEICRKTGASDVQVARTEKERAALWAARRSISPSLARRAPNKLGEDISVPRSAIPAAVTAIKEVSRKFSIDIFSFVLMPNHIHILLRQTKSNLSVAMKNLFERYVIFFNKK